MQEHSLERVNLFSSQQNFNCKSIESGEMECSLTIRAIFINVHLQVSPRTSKLPINFRSVHSALRFESYWNFLLLLSLNKVIEVDKDFVAFPPILSTQRNYSPFHNFYTLCTPFSFSSLKNICVALWQ